jgi:hypothetical protein
LSELIGSASVLVVSAVVFGPLTGWYAGRRDRSQLVWLVFGALLGPVALVLLAISPPGRCPACDDTVDGWPANCATCGSQLRGGPAPVGVFPHADWDDISARPAVATAGPAEAQMPIPLPAGRAPRPRPSRSGDVPIGVRAGATVAIPPDHADAGEVLATGVYFGGTAGLVVGSRYAIVKHGLQLQLLGPVDRDPSAIALERPLAGLTATAIGERLIISEGSGNRLAIALGSFAGASGPELEVALSLPPERPANVRPVSG